MRHDSGVLCSFCNKHQREVAQIIAGPMVYICNECIELSVWILNEEKAPKKLEFEGWPTGIEDLT